MSAVAVVRVLRTANDDCALARYLLLWSSYGLSLDAQTVGSVGPDQPASLQLFQKS